MLIDATKQKGNEAQPTGGRDGGGGGEGWGGGAGRTRGRVSSVTSAEDAGHGHSVVEEKEDEEVAVDPAETRWQQKARGQQRPSSAPASDSNKVGSRVGSCTQVVAKPPVAWKREHGTGKRRLVPVTVLEMVDAVGGPGGARGGAEVIGSCPILGPGKAAFSELNVISRQMVQPNANNAAAVPSGAVGRGGGSPRQESPVEDARRGSRSGDGYAVADRGGEEGGEGGEHHGTDGQKKRGKFGGYWGQGRAPFGSSSRALTHRDESGQAQILNKF
jgi:hypothetical protein